MSNQDAFKIRQGTVADAGQIALHRRLIFEEIRDYSPNALATMQAKYQDWVAERMERGAYFAWFALNEAGEIIAGVGVWLREWPISPRNPAGRDAHVLDVYVQPDYRGQGIARTLMETLVEWCQKQGLVTITLETSDAARPLYETLGFEMMDMMRKRLR